MITPQDIDNKVFKKSLWGYNVNQVEDFLEEIMLSYQVLYKENLAATERIAMLSEAVKQYKAMEDSLMEKEDDGEKMAEELKQLEYQCEQMKKNIEVYRAKVVALLNAQLDIIKEYPDAECTD